MEDRLKSRYRGALLGLAVGDALGTTLEFQPPGSFEPIADMLGGGPFGLEPGQWTDDTAMALCLAESLIETKGFDPVDQLRRYLSWYREGVNSSTGECFDIGLTTRAALHRFEETGEPYPGATHERSAGNGSIMRLAPVPLAFAADIEEVAELASESSRTTHGAAAAVDACRFLGVAIATAVGGAGKDAVLSKELWSGEALVPEISAVVTGSYKRKSPPEIRAVATSCIRSRPRFGHCTEVRSSRKALSSPSTSATTLTRLAPSMDSSQAPFTEKKRFRLRGSTCWLLEDGFRSSQMACTRFRQASGAPENPAAAPEPGS